MVDNQLLIDDVIRKLKDGADDLDSFMFLKEKGVNVEDCQEILTIAKSQLLEERIPYLSRRNKTLFLLWVLITIIVLVVDFFILPNPSFIEFRFILCLLGSAALTLCCYLLIVHYKTWTDTFLREHGNIKITFGFLPIFILPAIVFYFMISWRFTSISNQSLAKDMVKAKGTIISGYSITSRRSDVATQVTVEFATKEGEKIIATEDISSYSFKQFYKGQLVDLVYSKANPANIDLLTTGTDIRELTKTEDRDIYPADLIELMNVSPENMEEHLDKITYGWELNKLDTSWQNSRKHFDLKVSRSKVVFNTKTDYWITFPKHLLNLDFKALSLNSSTLLSRKPKLFENDFYVANVELKGVDNGDICMITITKK